MKKFKIERNVITFDGQVESYLNPQAANHVAIFRYLESMTDGKLVDDWFPSPLMFECEDAIRSATQKTVCVLNKRLKNLRILTKNQGKEIKLIERTVDNV